MMTDIYTFGVTGALGLLIVVTVWNLLRFKAMANPQAPYQGALPRVSVMIPARDEERGIERCVRSVCMQDYPNLEVIVLDDGSTDATGEILSNLCTEFSALRVINGTPLPEGWMGKVWACEQMSKQATGDVLIFTDADTVHHPQTVSATVRTFQQEHFDFFSIITHQQLETWAEHTVIPIVHLLFFAHLPSDLVIHHPSKTASAANGQFMAFQRSAYEGIGGHSSVKNAIIEDVELARVMKRAQLRIGLIDGTRYVTCRMYTNAREVIDGFSKNFFAGTGYSVLIMTAMLAFFAACYILPVVMLFLTTPTVPLLHLAMAAVIRGVISLKFRLPLWHMILMPLSAIFVVAIGIRSTIWAYSSSGSQWKGRSYGRPARKNA